MLERLLPPALAWRLGRATRERRELESFAAFYGSFLTNGALCFDIGANLGNRTRCFRHLGCEVVAVEPQGSCFKRLEHQFRGDAQVHLRRAAMGRAAGEVTLHLSSDHVLSTVSREFIRRTQESGRFAASRWDRQEVVPMTTLDALVAEFGVPRFVKIDVEGYESEVLAGLSQALPMLSMEWTPEIPENTLRCLERLSELGNYEYNLSWGESMRFSRPQWRDLTSMLTVLREFEGESLIFGDVYARLIR